MRPMLLCTAILAAIAAPTAAAAAPEATSGHFLKLGDVKPALRKVEGGEGLAVARSGGGGGKWIEIQGWDWEVRRKGWDGTVKGGSVAEKRQHDWRPSPHALQGGGTVRIKVKFPWVGCTVGDRIADATIGAGTSAYDLTDLTIAECAADAVTLDYAKVRVRGWNPETKEL